MEQGHTGKAVGRVQCMCMIRHACIAVSWGYLEKFARENRVHKGPLQGPHHIMFQPIPFKFCHKRVTHTAKSICTTYGTVRQSDNGKDFNFNNEYNKYVDVLQDSGADILAAGL